MAAEEIRLHAGEIDPETMRTVLAVTRGMAREVIKAHNIKVKELIDANNDLENQIIDVMAHDDQLMNL